MASKVATRRLKCCLGSFQLLTGILLTLFLLCLYHRHSSMELVVKSSKINANESSETSIMLKQDEDQPASAETNGKAVKKTEMENGNNTDQKKHIQSHIVGEFLVICLGVLFVALVIAGLCIDILCIPTTCMKTADVRGPTPLDANAEVDISPGQDNSSTRNDGGILEMVNVAK